MAKQSKAQKETVERVMHEFKHGELQIQGGRKVKNPKQAIAIALREAGASNQESPKKNRQNLRKTKAKESRGETGQTRKAGSSARKTTRGQERSNPRGPVRTGQAARHRGALPYVQGRLAARVAQIMRG